MNRRFHRLLIGRARLAVAGMLAVSACASAPEPRQRTSRPTQSSACPSYLNDTTMNVVHAPGRVIVVWEVDNPLFGDTAPAENYVRRLAKHVSAELMALYPGSTTVYAHEPQRASFTLSNANTDLLDQVRAELDRAVEKFHDGTCRGLVKGNRRPSPSVAAVQP